MPQQVYDLGDFARLSVEFTVGGVLTAPTTVTASVRKPDGTATAYATPTIVNDSTGKYHLDITVDQTGQWAYKFTGTGAAADVGPGVFFVKPDPTLASPYLYVPVDAVKARLKITGTDSDPDITKAIESASRAIDNACGRRFYQDTTTRYYTAGYYDSILTLGDVQSVTAVTVDADGTGTYETTWVEDTDFYLAPVGSDDVYSQPFNELVLLPQVGRRFPDYHRAIKVTGTFGWNVPPPGVRDFTEILAAKLLRRATEAPFGFVLSGNDLGSITRLARTDPDFDLLVGPYRRNQHALRSLTLT